MVVPLIPRSRRSRLWVLLGGVVLLLVIGAGILLLRTAPDERAGNAVEQSSARAGPLLVRASPSPDPPRVTGNVLHLVIEAPEGRPVEGAEVAVTAMMPAMGAMPEMRATARVVPQGGGRYDAFFDLSMGGSWTLIVAVKSPAGEGTARFSMTVGSKGLIPVGGPAAPDGKPGSPEPGAVEFDPVRLQKIGVRSAPVRREPLRIPIRTVGIVTYDETRLSEVSLKFGGWVTRLEADATGEFVRRGDVLFTLYSPDLVTTQEEYLVALEAMEAARAREGADPAVVQRARTLVEAARERLRFWDIGEKTIDRLREERGARKDLPVVAPTSGYVIEKNVVEGAAVRSGERLYRIAELDVVWVEAEVYEQDLALLRVGQAAKITLPYLPRRNYEGKIDFIYPYLRGMTRTARVRIELPNPDLDLRPDMFAEVVLEVDQGERLLVPAESVIYAGPRRIVFVDRGGGRLVPREIEVGFRTREAFEVRKGLEEGERVVTSGNFLVASESRLRAALEWWRGEEEGLEAK